MIYTDISIVFDDGSGEVDLSSSLRGLVNRSGRKMEEAGAMGDVAESFEPGVEVDSFSAQFWQDYSSGGVDETISGFRDDDSEVIIVVMPTSSAVGPKNPSFTGTFAVENYERFTGEWGNKAVCTVDFALVDGAGVTRAEAAE